jgi:hypothetical protein
MGMGTRGEENVEMGIGISRPFDLREHLLVESESKSKFNGV